MRYIFIFLLSLSMLSCTDDYSKPNIAIPMPSDLQGTKLSANAIKLTWKSNSKGEDGFVIEKTILGTNNTSSFTVGAKVQEWTDNDVQAQTYRYSVYAFFKEKKSESISIVYQHTPVMSVRNFTITDQQTQLKLSWELPNDVFDQILIEKKLNNASFTTWKTLDKNATETIDDAVVPGTNSYRVFLVSGGVRSFPAEANVNFMALPSVQLTQLLASHFMLSADINLANDGGEPPTVGICWNTNANPTIENNKIVLSQKQSSNQKSIINLQSLLKNTNYHVRAYATNAKGTTYSNELTATLNAEPSAIQLQWTPMNLSGLPSEIQVYETSSTLNGRNFKAYYSIADMSTGNIELKTIFSSTAKRPSKFVTDATNETFYVIANGGYFGYQGSVAVSYSLVVDRGVKLADNIQALTRGSSTYQVTRGAFGVNQQQQPSLKWVYGNFSYNRANPNIEGELPQPHPSATHPETSEQWNAYTAIGGAPVLLRNGNIVFDLLKTSTGKFRSNYELLQTDIFSETARPPRTVIGRTADNKIVILVCDGRQAHSDGATLLEMAQILKGIGCVDALNLDGGGSTAMLAGTTLLNKPSDGAERAVPSVVGFVRRK